MAAEEDEWTPDDERGSGTRVAAFPNAFNCTDLGNAERLIARYRDRVRYCPQRKKWLLWDGVRWRWDETAAVERMAKRTARSVLIDEANEATEDRRKSLIAWSFKSEEAKRIKSMMALAQSEQGVPVLLDELDSDPYLLNCANGTVNLRTAELRDHRRSDLITRTTGVKYDFGARSELWDRVLSEACGGDQELATYLQHVIGYSLIGIPLERAFFFIYGPPGTSKSTLIDAVHSALGGYVEEADFDTWLQKPQVGGNRGDLVRLAGARLVTSREAKPGAKWDETLIKRITGGDPLTVAAKYENEVTFRPAFALLFAANDAPAAREDDDGFWARMRRIPITHQIPPERQDKMLKVRLAEPEHAQAILSWAVAGCASYLANGFPRCSAVEASTNEYRAELDHFSTFLLERCEFEPEAIVSRRDLRTAYERWADEVGRKSLLDARAIAKKLKARGCSEASPLHGYERWQGVQLKALGQKSEPEEDRWR
ncbi:MAG TPA: phage/plasmid primase, P4 family [Polyangiaceae bacterium]|nr:phage/plasmid primase, P4 family [Polyangiaceae bacterium]